jgi:hypothetical protein
MTSVTYPAKFIVHWPGKDTPACLDHMTKLKKLSNVMGFALSVTHIVDNIEGLECSNCVNEAKKHDTPTS